MDFPPQRYNRGIGVKSATSSPLFTSRATSAMSVSGRSNASMMQIATHADFQIESFGLPYPVQVSEALTFGKSTVVSVSCSNNGWAWAVFGRKLYVWQYREPLKATTTEIMTPQRRTLSGQCRVLTLPHSDIGHKAQLVTVFVSEGHQMASCLASSPTGDVRYWPSIANDGASIDENGIMDGQEFDQLLIVSPQNYLLVTTTCHLVLLQLQHSGSRQGIGHRLIRPPSGFLGGIGRKIRASIFGSNSGEKENKLIKVCGERTPRGEFKIFILADRWLQEWSFGDGAEQLKFEDTRIMREIRGFYLEAWKSHDANDIKLWLLDMQVSKGTQLILAAGVNLSGGTQIEFSLLSFVPDEDGMKLTYGHMLKGPKQMYTDTVDEDFRLKFIFCRGFAYIYDETKIFPVQLIGGDPEELDCIELKSQGDKVLAAATIDSIAMFFSRNYGVVSITPSDFDANDTANNSMSLDILTAGMPLTPSGSFSMSNLMSHNNLSVYDYDPAEITSTSNDIVNQLKAAFVYHLKRNNKACEEIIDALILENWNGESDGSLDRAIITIVQEMAEDVPAADPRWQATQGEETHPLGSSTSLQIIQQLRDKNTALNHFVNYLKATSLYGRLNSITDHHKVVRPTTQIITDISEKIVAAIALKNIHNRCTIVDEGIELVLCEKKIRSIESLTNQDLFYVKVTHVQDILHAFIKLIENNAVHETAPSKMQEILIEINAVVLAMLNEVTAFRNKQAPQQNEDFEYRPWTSISGKSGAYDPIIQLINLNMKQNLKSIGAPDVRQKYFLQLAELVDFVLSNTRANLESVRDYEKRKLLVQKYETLRSDLIAPFVDNDQYDLATRLAEKYQDFQTLVLITDKTDNQQRLAEYNDKFKDFSQFAINWHLKQNKQSSIFERFRHDQAALGKFLGDHPSLEWIHLFETGDFGKASQILFALAQNEKDLVARKRTQLSLAKLAAMAADTEAVSVEEINAELVLIQHQEHLSRELLHNFGYDVVNPKVMSPEEIIHLYISDENTEATEEEFRKALELLNYVEFREESRIKIWCAAILKDTWSDYDVNAPLDAMQSMIFFKLIDLCYMLDGRLDTFLPPIEYLLNAPELEKLKNDQQFQFLLKFGYEHVYEAYAVKAQEEDM